MNTSIDVNRNKIGRQNEGHQLIQSHTTGNTFDVEVLEMLRSLRGWREEGRIGDRHIFDSQIPEELGILSPVY